MERTVFEFLPPVWFKPLPQTSFIKTHNKTQYKPKCDELK